MYTHTGSLVKIVDLCVLCYICALEIIINTCCCLRSIQQVKATAASKPKPGSAQAPATRQSTRITRQAAKKIGSFFLLILTSDCVHETNSNSILSLSKLLGQEIDVFLNLFNCSKPGMKTTQ